MMNWGCKSFWEQLTCFTKKSMQFNENEKSQQNRIIETDAQCKWLWKCRIDLTIKHNSESVGDKSLFPDACHLSFP